jgi:hypothetical protein
MNTSREPVMNRIHCTLKSEEGNVLIVALLFLVILTLIGIFSTNTARMDMQIASNEIPYKRNFYLAEAGLYREAAELGRNNYPVTSIYAPDTLARRGFDPLPDKGTLPGAPHLAFGQPYDFLVEFIGFFPPPPGFSALHFSRFDYNVGVRANNVSVESRLYRIGPKAE